MTTWVRERVDVAGVTRPVTADDLGSFVLFLADGEVATVTLSAVAHHGPGDLTQITGSEGTIQLTDETKLEVGRAGASLEDVSAPDDLWECTKPNTMWARAFVRLMRDFVRACGGALPTGEPATFRDGWVVQRVLDAVRGGGTTRLD